MTKKILILLVTLTGISQAQYVNTPNIGLEVPNTGATNWNLPLNYNFNLLDQIIGGTLQLPSVGLNLKPVYNIGTPTIGCSSANQGQMYFNISTSPYTAYTCNLTVWQATGAVGGPFPFPGIVFGTSATAARLTVASDIQSLLSTLTGCTTTNLAYAPANGYCTGTNPIGAAGGDLSGSYPNPTVTKVNAGSVPISAGFLGSNPSGQFISSAYTPENTANKNIANGYAPLDSGVKVPLVNLPTIPASQTSGFATVATSGSYTDLNSKPQLPITLSATTSNWINGYSSTTGLYSTAQPSFSNVSGSAACSQLPALVGDATSTAGTCTTSVSKLNGTSLAGLSTGIAVITNGTGVPSTIAAPTGTVVGTSDTQTLTNKTLTSPILSGITSVTTTSTGATVAPLTVMAPSNTTIGNTTAIHFGTDQIASADYGTLFYTKKASGASYVSLGVATQPQTFNCFETGNCSFGNSIDSGNTLDVSGTFSSDDVIVRNVGSNSVVVTDSSSKLSSMSKSGTGSNILTDVGPNIVNPTFTDTNTSTHTSFTAYANSMVNNRTVLWSFGKNSSNNFTLSYRYNGDLSTTNFTTWSNGLSPLGSGFIEIYGTGDVLLNASSDCSVSICLTDNASVDVNGRAKFKSISNSQTVTITAGAAAGTSPTIACHTTITCTPSYGMIDLTPGTGATTGDAFTISWTGLYDHVSVGMSQGFATSSHTAVLMYQDPADMSTGHCTFYAPSSLTAGASFTFTYNCL